MRLINHLDEKVKEVRWVSVTSHTNVKNAQMKIFRFLPLDCKKIRKNCQYLRQTQYVSHTTKKGCGVVYFSLIWNRFVAAN